MKKKLFWIAAAVSIIVTLSASVWEGAGTVDNAGSLPVSGYYVATNSFPRNTIVDLTNLETGTSIRVIVADTLNSPGLLAVVSKEAATAIGLQNRSVGRIRMSMPADPIAFSRFTEGLSSSGDPDRDPKATVAANPASPVAAPEAKAVAAAETAPAAPAPTAPTAMEPSAPAAVPVPAPVPPVSSASPPAPAASVVTPETPSATSAAETPVPSPGPVASETVTPSPAEGSVAAVLSPSPVPDTGTATSPVAVPPEPQTQEGPAAITPENTGANVATNEIVDVPESYTPPTTEKKPVEAVPEEKPAVPPTQKAGPVDLSLVPAEPRPPEAGPDAGVSAQVVAPIAEPKPVAQDTIPLDVPRVAPLPPPAGTASAAGPGGAASPASSADGGTVDGIATAASAPIPPPPSTASEAKPASENFGAPVIEKLRKGSYYVQVAALGKEQLVQDAVHQLGSKYPLAVQRAGTPAKPFYRVLVGPVNQGESAALLQRFKKSGYPDAFIKIDG